MNHIKCSCTFLLLCGLLFYLNCLGVCWRAVPANQAMYALRSLDLQTLTNESLLNSSFQRPDDFLPRDHLSFTYKFGWCRSDVLSKHFLRKSVNLTLPTWKDQQADYIYLLENKHTRRYAFQCIVMKAYVNRKYLFFKSRLPLYYCQGEVFILLLRTVKRYAIHEFYMYHKIDMPVDFVFEFYQAPPL